MATDSSTVSPWFLAYYVYFSLFSLWYFPYVVGNFSAGSFFGPYYCARYGRAENSFTCMVGATTGKKLPPTMLRFGTRRLFSTGRSLKVQQLPPPTHFSNQPPTHFTNIPSPSPISSSSHTAHHENQQAPTTSPSTSLSSSKHLRELTILLTIITLSFLTVDNYINRIKLEKLINETTAINLKTLKTQQVNFNAAQKRKNLQIISERRDNMKKFTKMGLHIAMLRKQLTELGHDPAGIENVLAEYEKSIKVNSSVNNVIDQVLYLSDDSNLKEYYPSIHEYEKAGGK